MEGEARAVFSRGIGSGTEVRLQVWAHESTGGLLIQSEEMIATVPLCDTVLETAS